MENLIIKKFDNLDINIYGTNEKPLFKANDIGELLGLVRIRKTIEDFNDDCKVKTSATTSGGNRNQIFLTEKGLYKILFISRKPIAEKFQNWVFEVIKEIRINGVYNLEQQLLLKDKETQKLIEDNEKNKIINKHEVYLKEYNFKRVFYLCLVNILGEILYKFGYSDNINRRYSETFNVTILLNLFKYN